MTCRSNGARRNGASCGAAVPKLTAQVVREDYIVRKIRRSRSGSRGGMLRVDRLTEARAGIVALTVGQSAAMEYYENVVEAAVPAGSARRSR